MQFSILIPVYNTEKYLKQCIESLLGQTNKEYEILLVDDGSTDRSGAICDAYASQYPYCIRVLHQENKGVLLTRRVLAKEAKGEFVVWVDSDDRIAPDALETFQKTIQKYDCDIIIYNYALINENGSSVIKEVHSLPAESGTVYEGEKKLELYERMVAGKHMNELWTKCMKRHLIDTEVDYSQWKHVKMGDDLFCLFPIVTAAQKTVYLDTVLYYYRTVEGSITHTPNLGYYDSYKTVYERTNQYMEMWGLSDSIKSKAKYRQIVTFCGTVQLAFEEARQQKEKEIFAAFMEKVYKDGLLADLVSTVPHEMIRFPYNGYCHAVVNQRVGCLYIYIALIKLVSKAKHHH